MELVIRGKYGEEMELAMQHTAALQLNASRYVTARPLVGQPQLNDSKAATSAPPHGHRQSLPTHDLLGVGRPSDVWRPAYSPANHSAADRESSIWLARWHAEHTTICIPYAVLGVCARASTLSNFVANMSNPLSQQVLTLIRWDIEGIC